VRLRGQARQLPLYQPGCDDDPPEDGVRDRHDPAELIAAQLESPPSEPQIWLAGSLPESFSAYGVASHLRRTAFPGRDCGAVRHDLARFRDKQFD
jgi:hypothetical protein